MGCGCSMQKKRVAAAQKGKDDTTTAKALEGADQTSPDKPVNEHHAAQVPPPLVEEREFLQGMSPPSSPVAKPSQPASNNKDPTWAASETAAADTENPSSATRSMVGREKEGALAGGSIAVPLVAAANVDRQSGEILEPMESEEEGGGTRINNRPVEQLLQSVEPKGRIPRISGQEPLPRISPSTRGPTDFPVILARGGGLGPGLDIAFREEPENITATEVTDGPVSDSGSGGGKVSGNGERSDDRTPSSEAGKPATVGSARSPKTGVSSSYEEVLVITPVTPDDDVVEDGLSEQRAPTKDRWPRDDRDVDSSEVAGRYRHKRRDDEDAPPPRQEARPALAAGVEANTSSYSVRASLSVVDLYSEDENGMSAATGGVDASADSGAWGDSGAYSLLDAEEEDFMETLLTES